MSWTGSWMNADIRDANLGGNCARLTKPIHDMLHVITVR